MPPEPGKIQSLPVKVLYTIDTSPQSYLTVLPDRHDVFVHPRAAADDLLGSVALKPLGRGVCFASPECVPSPALDFSVYNLEPGASKPSPRAFPVTNATTSSNPSTSASSAPPANATPRWTGRGFLSWALSEAGAGRTLARGRLVRGYEFSPASFAASDGLEALVAAARAGGDENDGKGWGLEVTLTFRQLNPEGKREFAGRRAFEDMLQGGKSTASAPLAVASSPVRPSGRDTGSNNTFAKPSLPVRTSPRRHGPARSTSSSSGPSNASVHNHHVPYTAHASSSTAHPPSSSSAHPPSSSSTARSAPYSSTPQAPHSSTPLSPTPTRSSIKPEQPRATTPPPKPTDARLLKTPPPPSPNRLALIQMLKNEGKMSPDMARKLANNTFLARLLKAATPGSGSGSGSGLAAGTPSGSGAVPPSPSRTGPSAGTRSVTAGPSGANQAEKPAHPFVSHPPPAPSSDPAWAMTSSAALEGCYNCGETESEGWMTKKLKDGGTGRVCNPCGSYYNKNRRMRPRELWAPSPAQPVRSSPRLNRRAEPPAAVTESPRKRRKAAPPPSPRMATRASARAEAEDATTPTPGGGGGVLDFSSHFPFGAGVGSSASTPGIGAGAGIGAGTANGGNLNGGGDGSADDLAAMFLEFGDENGNGSADGISLEALLGNDTESILEMLRTIESESGHHAQSAP